jgi:hypothetical protein
MCGSVHDALYKRAMVNEKIENSAAQLWPICFDERKVEGTVSPATSGPWQGF